METIQVNNADVYKHVLTTAIVVAGCGIRFDESISAACKMNAEVNAFATETMKLIALLAELVGPENFVKIQQRMGDSPENTLAALKERESVLNSLVENTIKEHEEENKNEG